MEIDYQNDKLFEPCKPNYKLKKGDRGKRVGYGADGKWYPIPDFDIGQKASYFTISIVQKLKTN